MSRFLIATAPDGALAGFGQIKPLEDHKLELSSLVVHPEYRGQGLGKILAAELLSRAGSNEVFLVTIGKRQNFYEQCGFEVVSIDGGAERSEGEAAAVEVPLQLKLEKLLGTPIAFVFAEGSRLIVMRWKSPSCL